MARSIKPLKIFKNFFVFLVFVPENDSIWVGCLFHVKEKNLLPGFVSLSLNLFPACIWD